MASTISNNGMYLIINSGSGTAIDLNNGGGNNGTKVQGWHPAWNSGKIQNQAWIFVDQGNSYWKLFNKAGGSCMDLDNGSKGNGTPIQGWGSTNTDAQLWKFEQVGDRNGMPAAWKITNKKSGTVVDLDNDSNSNGAKVQGWESKNVAAQRWVLVLVDRLEGT